MQRGRISGTIRGREGYMSGPVRSDSTDNQAAVEVGIDQRTPEDASSVVRRVEAYKVGRRHSPWLGGLPRAKLGRNSASVSTLLPVVPARGFPVLSASCDFGRGTFGFRILIPITVGYGVTGGMTRGSARGGSIPAQVVESQEV